MSFSLRNKVEILRTLIRKTLTADFHKIVIMPDADFSEADIRLYALAGFATYSVQRINLP